LTIEGEGELSDDLGNILGIVALLNVDAKIVLRAWGEKIDLTIKDVGAGDIQKLEDAARAISDIDENIKYTISVKFAEPVEITEDSLDYLEPLNDTGSKKSFTVERGA